MSQSILIPALALAAVLAAGLLVVLVVVRRDPRAATQRIESLFRRKPRTAGKPGADHYYKPYWS